MDVSYEGGDLPRRLCRTCCSVEPVSAGPAWKDSVGRLSGRDDEPVRHWRRCSELTCEEHLEMINSFFSSVVQLKLSASSDGQL